MCQVSLYVKEHDTVKLVKDNITAMEIVDNGIRVNTLFEGSSDLVDMALDHIDFSAGKVVLQKI